MKQQLFSYGKIYFFVLFCYVCSIVSQDSLSAQYYNQLNTSYSSSTGDVSEIERKALQRGYTKEQLEAARRRYPSKFHSDSQSIPQKTFSDSSGIGSTEFEINTKLDSVDIIEDDSVASDKEEERYYGYSLFKNIPDAFKPNAFGPVDPGYLVSPGDVLRLSVWGEVEFQYELKINKEGTVFIPIVGQVYVTGIAFGQLQRKLQKLLSRHYSGLASNPQKSFMDLSVAQLSPIRIFVMGEVASPGGYMVSSSSTAFNALYSVGGPTINGTLRDITIIRQGKELTTIDIYEYLTSGKCSTDKRLQNDDVIFITKRGKTVIVNGSVFKPLIYELNKEEHFQSLLSYCGGVLPQTNLASASIHRTVPFENRNPSRSSVEVINFDLKPYVTGNEDLELFDQDTVIFTSLYNDMRNYAVLQGAVQYPGMYQCDSISLASLIFTLGKPLEGIAYNKRADLLRMNSDGITRTTIPIDLDKLNKDPSYDQLLQPRDEVVVYPADVEKPVDLEITVEGEVKRPGIYSMSTNMTILDAILQAGGYTRAAYKKSVDIYRLDLKNPDRFTEVFAKDLPDSLDFNDTSESLFRLKDRDKIVVRPDPDYVIDNYVQVTGLVSRRGKYALQSRSERLSDIIELAGELLPNAFLEGATIIRDEKRLIINFKEALYGNKEKENIILKPNDSIFIPQHPNTIYVHGNVNNPGLFSYIKDYKLKDYIDRAGGFADSTAFTLLTAPNGETRKFKRLLFNNPVLHEGSEILVKRKPSKNPDAEKNGPSITEVVRDTLAILASAVTVIGLAIQLKR